MRHANAELIDRVSAKTGLHLTALAERLGLQERTLKRIRAGEVSLSDSVRLHLLDLERLAAVDHLSGENSARSSRHKMESSRIHEETTEYHTRSTDEALRMVIMRMTHAHSVKELAQLISDFASDEDMPPPLRTRVVKMLSDLIPERMK